VAAINVATRPRADVGRARVESARIAGDNTGVNRLGPWRRRAREAARLTGASAWHGVEAFAQSDNLTYAASIAYYALVSLFPIFLLSFVLLGRVTADVEHRNTVLRFVLQYFPSQFDFITRQLEAFRRNGLSVGIGGMVALLWGAGGVFGAITTAVNYAWGVERQPSYWKHKLVSFTMLSVAGLMLLVAVLLVSASNLVGATWFAGVLANFPGLAILRGIAVRYATTLLFIAVVGLVYYFVPNADVRFRDVWVGAVVTGLLWKGALEVFSWYVRDMTRFTRVNGSVSIVIVFLAWVYVQAVILLYGAQFTAAYARLRRGRPEDAPAAPAPSA
jgi:membrane protein